MPLRATRRQRNASHPPSTPTHQAGSRASAYRRRHARRAYVASSSAFRAARRRTRTKCDIGRSARRLSTRLSGSESRGGETQAVITCDTAALLDAVLSSCLLLLVNFMRLGDLVVSAHLTSTDGGWVDGCCGGPRDRLTSPPSSSGKRRNLSHRPISGACGGLWTELVSTAVTCMLWCMLMGRRAWEQRVWERTGEGERLS